MDNRARALQYAAELGDASLPSVHASHARNLRTTSLHDPSAESTWAKKSQQVLVGGKEPVSCRLAEMIGQVQPRREDPHELPQGRVLKGPRSVAQLSF